MAVDYLFVGQALTFVLGSIFMLMALGEDSPLKIAYHLFASIAFIFLGQLFLMAYSSTTTYVVPLHYFFYMFGIINFILFVVYGAGVFMYSVRKRKYGDQEWD